MKLAWMVAGLMMTMTTRAVEHDAAVEGGQKAKAEASATASHAIRAFTYDRDAETLVVEFRNGSAYRYDEVPFKLFRDFAQAPSTGRFYHIFIRGRFPATRVEMEPLVDEQTGKRGKAKENRRKG